MDVEGVMAEGLATRDAELVRSAAPSPSQLPKPLAASLAEKLTS
jgi:hypothetical protein